MIVGILTALVDALRIRTRGDRREVPEEEVPLAEVEVFIANMVCEGCAETVGARLEQVPGVRAVRSRVGAKRVVIQFEAGRVSESELRRILAASGFDAVTPE